MGRYPGLIEERREAREGEAMATVIRREVRERGALGIIFLILFWVFNAVMLFWLISYWNRVGGDLVEGDDARRTGAAIGVTIGTGMLFFFWVAGAVILGLFALLTRGQRVIIEEKRD